MFVKSVVEASNVLPWSVVKEDDAPEMKPPVQYERPEVVALVPDAFLKMRLVVEALYPLMEVKEEVAEEMKPPVRVARPV